MTSRQLATLAFVAFVWGGSFLFIRVLVQSGMEPQGMSAARTGIGAATLLPFAWRARRHFPRDGRTIAAIAALGAFNFALPWTLFGYGQKEVPSGVGSIVNSAMPLWTAIFSTLLIKSERIDGRRAVGLMLGFSGVVALMGEDLGNLGSASARGILLMLVATMCYGACTTSVRRWLGHVPAIPLTFGQVGVAAVLLWPYALLSGAFDNAEMGANEWVSMLILGAAGSGIAVVLYMWLIGQVGAIRAAVVTYMMPPIGVILGWLFLDESIGWNMVAGLALIIAGVGIVQGLASKLFGPMLAWGRVAPAAAND